MKKFLFTIVSFITLMNTGFVFSTSCPDPKKMDPCTCKIMAFGLHVMCADFDDSQALVNAFKNLRRKDVHTVVFHNLILNEVLPKDMFKGVNITILLVEKSKLTFSQPAFKGLGNSLNILRIAQQSDIKYSGDFEIAKLTNLTELNIKKNNLCTVKNSWLKGKVPNVVTINLDDDEISKIENKAFAYSPLLTSISIAGNRIKDVKRSMFPMPAKYLNSMDLSGNEIHSLPDDFFSEMDSLEEVVLSGNDLTTLPESTWGKVWKQLKTVLLFDNNLICDKSLAWIAKKGSPKQLEGKCVAPSALIGKELCEVYDSN